MSSSRGSRLRDWFSQRSRRERARGAIAGKSEERLRFEAHAAVCVEAADRVAHPVEPLRAGSGERAATTLYAEAVVACLRALDLTPDSLRAQPTLCAHLGRRLPDTVTIGRTIELAMRPGLDTTFALTSDEITGLREAAHALLHEARAPERELADADVRRAVRTGVPILALLCLFVWGGSTLAPRFSGPDLAEGKSFRTSSDHPGFDREAGVADGNSTDVFFHTKRERNPWVELDLEQPTTVDRIDIGNRTDCCRDRPLPLLVEGSLDGKDWFELGRRTEPFTRWTLRIEPTSVRYVRATAEKRTVLHFEFLEVR